MLLDPTTIADVPISIETIEEDEEDEAGGESLSALACGSWLILPSSPRSVSDSRVSDTPLMTEVDKQLGTFGILEIMLAFELLEMVEQPESCIGEP
jgi:hypothetical protein